MKFTHLMSLNFAIVFIFITIFSSVESNILNECRTSTGVGLAIAARVRDHDLDFDNKDGKCYVKCVCQKSGWCDKDFKINPEAIHMEKDYVSLEKLNEFALECDKIPKKLDCETAFERFKCLFEKMPEIRKKPE